MAIGCSDVYGNGGGDFLGDCPDYSWSDGNISSDPLFCDVEGGDLGLNTISRCLPDNNECGLLMGLYGEGCNDPLFRIMGRIVDDGGAGIMGISLYSDLSHALTDSNGNYMIVVPPGWSGTVTPESTGYDFTPLMRTYAEVQADIDEQGYIAERDQIHSVPSEFGTIQEAINVSLAGDTVLVEAGVHSGPGNLNLFLYGKPITLLGGENREEVIIDGEHAERGIYILGEACSGTVIKNLSFINCLSTDPSTAAGGAIRIEESGCNLENLILENCQSHTWGGGLHAHDGDLVISNVEVSGCFAWGNGGGISFRSTIVSATGLLITGNESGYNQNGPGLYQENGTSDISTSIIAFNNSETFTAGLIGTGEAILNMDCSDVFGNSFGNFGGVFEDLVGIDGNISEDPRFCEPEQDGFYLAADSPCLPANNDCGLLMGPYGLGCELPTGLPEDTPARAYLAQNVPNPFNPVTDIRLGLVEAGRVSLAVYDISGRRVVSLLAAEKFEAGEHVVKWSGRDDSGRSLSSGIYLYKLQANGREWTKKMTLIK